MLKNVVSNRITIVFNPIFGSEFKSSLFEPMLKPSEKIKIMIIPKEIRFKLKFFLSLIKYPSSIPASKNKVKAIRFNILMHQSN